ncbi:MAG: phosphoribosyltransferase family protein, partial [Mucinivorans sp.]
VPVPLHYSKFIKRGYNQSEEFARGVAHAMGAQLQTKALVRTRRTRTQARLKDSQARALNVENAFRVTRVDLLAGRGILVVDDVVTTGATIEAAAGAIARAVGDATLYLGAIAVVK